MNPLFQALFGPVAPSGFGTGQSPSAMPDGIMRQAQQLAGMFQNPQQMVQRFFPDAPANVQGNPDQLLQWMQQTGRVNPQMVQMVRSMVGR